MSDPRRNLKRGDEYAYDCNGETTPPKDWAHRAARGVLFDLQDRKGIKSSFYDIDLEIRIEIVEALAATIRAASPQPPAPEPVAWLTTGISNISGKQWNAITFDRAVAEDRAKYPGDWEVTPLFATPPDTAALVAQARREAFEEAAKVAENTPAIDRLLPLCGLQENEAAKVGQHEAAERIAAAIRALANQPQPKGDGDG